LPRTEISLFTFIDSVAEIALPHLAVYKVDEGIDVSAAQPAAYNVDALNNRQALWEIHNVRV